jgi:dolichol-phosphate mannosyltransferase
MDGDLQHPPELVPVLLDALASGNDIVMASRHCAGGSDDGLDGGYRRVVSWGCTWLAKVLFPVVLRGATDPMTGFFALRLNSISPNDLNARGFKILLDILVRNPRLRRTEVPLRFGKRHSGASKGDSRQGLEYLRQLPRLRATATFARQANRPRRDAVTGTATVIS